MSRQCPICRNNYAPRILYRSPQFITADQIIRQDSTPDQYSTIFQLAMSNVVLARQVALLARLITSSNVAVYFNNRMHFYLPESFLQEGGDDVGTEFRSLSASIPFNGEFDAEGRFLFSNDTWDALENEIEGEGEEEEEGEDEGEEDGEPVASGENEQDAEVEDEEGNETNAMASAAAEAEATIAAEAAAVTDPVTDPVTGSAVVAAQAADETDDNAAVVAAGEGGGLANGVRLTAKEALKSIFLLLLRGGR